VYHFSRYKSLPQQQAHWYPVFFSAVAAITILPLAVILFFFEGFSGYPTPFPYRRSAW
jgi:hypothetical protein